MQWIFGTGHHSVFLDPQTTRNKWQANAINLPWPGMLYTIHSDSKWWWLGDGFLELSHDYPMIIPWLSHDYPTIIPLSSHYVPKSLYPYITPLNTIVVTIVIIIPSKHPIMIHYFPYFTHSWSYHITIPYITEICIVASALVAQLGLVYRVQVRLWRALG